MRDRAAKGVGLMTVEPEHGTDGYQHKLPYTYVTAWHCL